MSRKLVLAGAFFIVLPVMLLSAKARGEDPPKDAGPNFSDPEELKLLRNSKWKVESDKPKVDVAKPQVSVAKPKPSSGPKLHGGEKAILKALKEEAKWQFVETPLKDILDSIQNEHHIPVRMDSAALKEAGVDESTPVTCEVSGISLRSALDIILDDLKLKWTIHHEVLMITTLEKAESDEFMDTKSYDVTDLVTPPTAYNLQNPVSPVSEKFGRYENDAEQKPFVISRGGMPPVGMGNGPSLANNTPPAILAAAGAPQIACGGIGGAANGNGTRFVPYDVQPLEDLITGTMATKTWQDNGGTGTIAHHDGMLIISQTREVHTQIEQFLDGLRERRQARPVMAVELHWLWLDAKHRHGLLAGRAKASDGQVSLAVDRLRLRETAREAPSFHGQVVSMSGLPATITAGDRRSIVVGAIPVVSDGVGYQPVISVPNVGVTAQVRATFVPGTKTAMLDIASIITRWGPERRSVVIGAAWPAGNSMFASRPAPASPNPAPPASSGMGGGMMGSGKGGTNGKGDGFFAIPAEQVGGNLPPQAAPPAQNPTKPGPVTPPPVTPSVASRPARDASASCPIDLPVMPTQQIGGTLRVPLGQPVIVGSITFAPAGDAGLGAATENPVEVYLIATTSIVREAGK